MDGSNSEFNKIVSAPYVQPHESCDGSMDCASTNDTHSSTETDERLTNNIQKNTRINSLYASLYEKICVDKLNAPDSTRSLTDIEPRNDTHNKPETYNCPNTSLSSDDIVEEDCVSKETLNAGKVSGSWLCCYQKMLQPPGACDCPMACASTNDTHSFTETGESLTNSITKSTLLNSLYEKICVDKPNASDTTGSLTDIEPRNETHNKPETYNCPNASLSSDDTVEDIYRIITGLSDISYNEEELLNGNTIASLHTELRDLQKKGFFTHQIISVINEVVREKNYKEINWEVYKQMIEALNTYENIDKSANDINTKVFEMKNTETVTFLTEKNQLTKEVILGFEIIDKGKADIQRKRLLLIQLDIPGIVESMKTLEELGLMSEILLLKLTNVGRELAGLAREIRFQRKRINDLIDKINKNVTIYKLKQAIDGNNEDGTVVVYINCRNDDSPDIKERKKQQKKAGEHSKSNICRSEHNIPFCGKCGWRNSWVKGFKKRGVYIKEATDGNNKHTWINSINKN